MLVLGYLLGLSSLSLSLRPSLHTIIHINNPMYFVKQAMKFGTHSIWDRIYTYAHVDACVSQSIDDILGLNIWITYNILTSSFSWLPHINS